MDDLRQAKSSLSDWLLRSRQPIEILVPAGKRSLSRRTTIARDIAKNVHGVGIGPKLVNGRAAEQWSLRIYVRHKIPLAYLPAADRLPKSIEGMPTDVIEDSPAYFAHGSQQWRCHIFHFVFRASKHMIITPKIERKAASTTKSPHFLQP